MVALKNLTKATWQTIKKNAGIEKSPWFKKADAAVGPAVAKLEKTRAAWKSNRSGKTLMAYVGALQDLDKAFNKFLAKQAAAAEINQWRTEINAKLSSLASKYDEKRIRDLDAENLKKQFDQFIL